MGFGAPTAYYFDFVNHPENAALKAKLQTLIDSEMGKNGRQPMEQPARLKLISEIQTMFLEASVPAELASKLETKIEQFKRDFARAYPKSPLKKIKVRSSSNAEDIESFDGAGLHESYSAKLKDGVGNPKERCRVVEGAKGVETKREVQPETLMCAVKAVYASLWTRRAIDERSFARINHATAAMGLAINQKYDFRGDTEGVREVANAVLMTRMIAADGVYGYQLSLNTPDNLVTNPTPGTQSEIVLASFFADKKTEFTVTQYAITELGKPVDTTQIVDRAIYERMVRIAKAVEIGYCKANPRFYGGDCTNLLSDREKPKWMAMEFKIFSNGEVLLKQAREVGGVEKR
jgi:phosphoenolpyruvate synthase/pyruvate phosphate dikinase